MSTTQTSPLPSQVTARTRVAVLSCLLALVVGLMMLFSTIGDRAFAAVAAVDLGTAETYSVLGGQTVTNTGPTTLDGNVGVSPKTAITGFPPGLLLGGGVKHEGDTQADMAQADLLIAYNDAKSRAPIDNVDYALLGGKTLVAGVYNATSTMALTGTVTLDGKGRTDGVWIFQVGSALDIATSGTVSMTNGANACNVFWQVGSSATIGTNAVFVGTVMTLASVTVKTDAVVQGRALALSAGSVTLDSNVFTGSACNLVTPTPSVSSSPPVSPPASSSPPVSPPASSSPPVSPPVSPSVSPTVTATQSETESPSPTVIDSRSATEQPTETSSELETESQVATTSTTGSGGNLARTGSSGLTSVLAIGGLALLAAGGALLITGRLRLRRQGRHQG